MRLIGALLAVPLIGLAAFATRPTETAMKTQAIAVLEKPRTLSEGVESFGAAVGGEGEYRNYFVASRYVIALGGRPLVSCWGALTATLCDRLA
jgi:hypothetical protein